MKTQLKNPFTPFVSMEQIVAFDKDEKEAWTESRFLNAVLLAIETVGVSTSQTVADYLDMKPAAVTTGLQIVCGMNLTQLRTLYAVKLVVRLRKEHPDWQSDRIARHIGFDNRATVWNIIHNRKNADIVKLIEPHLLEEHRKILRPQYDWETLRKELEEERRRLDQMIYNSQKA